MTKSFEMLKQYFESEDEAEKAELRKILLPEDEEGEELCLFS